MTTRLNDCKTPKRSALRLSLFTLLSELWLRPYFFVSVPVSCLCLFCFFLKQICFRTIAGGKILKFFPLYIASSLTKLWLQHGLAGDLAMCLQIEYLFNYTIYRSNPYFSIKNSFTSLWVAPFERKNFSFSLRVQMPKFFT